MLLSLFSVNRVSCTKNFNVVKFVLRSYASCGVQHWDKPIKTSIKLEIEHYWRDKVIALNGNRTKNEADKFYVLSMFPYPSGLLHMGHVRVYTLSDSIARYYRMKDKYVIHPIGWDAFGLPAENAAIERKVDPEVWTKENIQTMREQLKSLACSFDWDREISTCDPRYFKWTQDLFLKLFDRNLIYKKNEYVNWDPVDATVLANEQISEDGTSWRSGAKVEKKLLNQWFIKTTAFAESLYEGLNDSILKEWNDIIKIQKHWIGECNGSNFSFELTSDDPRHPKSIDLWTSCPEFIKNVTFVAASPKSIFNNLKVFQGDEKVPPTKLTNVSFTNPFTKASIPIVLTNQVEFPSGREEYLGIPSASEKDAEICRAVGIDFEPPEVLSKEELSNQRNKILYEARERNLGGYMVSSHLKDWLISRQRFWGTPIPVIHCEQCGHQTVPYEQLPVVFPKIRELTSKEKSEVLEEWRKVDCPKCLGPALREIDTMDTFVDSAWYYLRYLDPHNEGQMISKKLADRFLPVDLYIGGKEHAALHLYFARFMNHFLHSIGVVPTREPFKQLLVTAFVMGRTHKVTESGKFIRENEVSKVNGKLVETSSGLPVKRYWDKMSKSKNNGADPVELIKKYSIDTVRLIIMSDAAPITQRNWEVKSFDIILNWENKLWLLMRQFLKLRKQFANGELEINQEEVDRDDVNMIEQRNYHLKRVLHNMVGTQHLSVVISKLQSMTKQLRKTTPSGMVKSREFERALAAHLIMIVPLAPHFASELWAGFCSAPGRLVTDSDEVQWDKEVLEQNYPQIDPSYHLYLYIRINNQNVGLIPLTQEKLLNSSVEELIDIVGKHVDFKKFIVGKKIVNAKTYLKSDVNLELCLSIEETEQETFQVTSG